MASIPLFTGVSNGLDNVRPDTDVISRLDPALFGKGASDARFVPTTGEAIANAITSGVQSYQKTREEAQTIEQKDLSLQAQRELQPQQIQTQQAILGEQQVKIAEEAKARQREDQLMSVFQSGTPEQKVAAVTSGEYADVFAKSPHLEQYAIKVAAPGMTEEEANAFLFTKQRQADQLRLEKNKEQLLNQYEKSESGLLANSDINQIFTQHPEFDGNLDRLTDAVAFERAGEFKRDAGGKLERGRDGKPIRDPNFGTEGGKESYHAISRDTGGMIMPNLSTETRKEVEAYVANKMQLKKIDSFGADRFVDTLKRARGVPTTPNMSSPRSSSGQNALTPPTGGSLSRDAIIKTGQDRAAQNPRPATDVAVSPGSITLPEFSKTMQSAPAVIKDGKIAFTKNPVATSLAAKSLGVTPEIAEKHSDKLAKVLDEAYTPIESPSRRDLSLGVSPTELAEYKQKLNEQEQMKESFAGELLSAEYRARETELSAQYSTEQVKAHNAAVDRTKEAITDFAAGKVRGNAIVTSPMLQKKVSSPEELYVLKNTDRVKARLDSLAATAGAEARRRANEQLRQSAGPIIGASASASVMPTVVRSGIQQ